MSTESRRILFLKEAQKKIVPDNSFRNFSVNDGALAIGAKTMTLPQTSGEVTGGTGEPNYSAAHNAAATVLGAKVFKGTKKSYDVTVLYTDPYVIENNGTKEMTYDKRSAITTAQADYLQTRFADYVANGWTPSFSASAPSVKLIETTGTATRTSNVTGGYAGLVKRITYQDLLNVRKSFQKMNLGKPLTGIKALITSEMWEDLMQIAEIRDFEKTGKITSLIDGTLYSVLGFDFLVRDSSVNSNVSLREASGAYTKIAFDGALTSADVSSALFWHPDFVRRAEGGVDYFIRENDPNLRGDVLGMEARIGATIWREDEAGVVCLVEKKNA